MTPMTESDLSLHLSHQTDLAIAGVPFTAYGSPDAASHALGSTPADAVVLDARDDSDLRIVGAALATLPPPVFAIGSGGLSRAIGAADPGAAAPPPRSVRGGGPVLALSGSRSPQTRRQADAARAAGWLLLPLPLAEDARTPVITQVRAALAAGRSVVVTSDDADVSAATGRPLLEAVAESAAAIIGAAVNAGATNRVIVCGGDTSSRVTRLLGIRALSIAANPWGNVVLLRADAPGNAVDGIQLLLKGGQVGEPDLFERIREIDA
jgi:uncharacterized protein YgbK (DUF1537 family)